MTVRAQGAAFTYQGRLDSGGAPATGVFDFQFALFPDSVNTNNQVDTTLSASALAVSNGLFTTELVFPLGAADFPGADRWLQISVRPSFAGSNYVALTPRQRLTSAPQAIFATSASNLLGTLPANSLTGALSPTQLPAAVVTNGGQGLNLNGTFGGTFGGFSNLLLSVNGTSIANGQTPNVIRFLDNPGTEQIWIHARKNMDFETVNDATFWVGRDFMQTIDHDYFMHVKRDETISVDRNLTETIGLNRLVSVGGLLEELVGSSKSETVGGTYTLSGNNVAESAINGFSITANDFLLQAGHNASMVIGANSTTTVGNSMQIAVGNNFSVTPSSGGVGVGTQNPQGTLHVYSANNPTVVRVQSTGTPGFGRLEFLSNPQGDINEWRPAFLQSLDAGGFTGGLGFYVNGAGAGNKFATNEVMRIQNGRVGINTTAPATALDVNGEIHWGQNNTLSVNQSGSIELGSSTTGGVIPFIDFHYGTGLLQDYNTRLINDADQQLDLMRSGSAVPMARFNTTGLTVNGTLVSTSDRNAKENFQAVDAQEVLAKVAALPVSRWNYKEDKSQQHLGPMAQDFYAAFGVGPDDKHIATVDAEGVALAAIQGLNQKLEETRAELKRRDAENAELKVRLEKLEQRFNQPATGTR